MASDMLIAGFSSTIAEKVVTTFFGKNTFFIESSLRGIEKFINFIHQEKPMRVIVFGQYSGKDKNKLRIETICTNKFRNVSLGDYLETLPILYFLQPTENIKLAKGIGNSWCNLLSYKIVTTFPNLPYTFIHVPKGFPVYKAKAEIQKQLE